MSEIEFRWLQKKLVAHKRRTNMENMSVERIEVSINGLRTLQFRTKYTVYLAPIAPGELSYPVLEWGPWQDVPIVEEKDNDNIAS